MHFWGSAVYLSYLFSKVMLSLSYAVTEFLLFIVQKIISYFFYILSTSQPCTYVLFFFFICELILLQSQRDDELS